MIRARPALVVAAAAALAVLAACSASSTDPSGATPSEARQLNEAAAMLDANSVDANAVTPDQEDQP